MLEYLLEEENKTKDKERLISILKNIIDTISDIENIEIMTSLTEEDILSLKKDNHSPETTWFFREKEKQKYIYIPPEAFTIPELKAKAKAAHESGHAAITRYYNFENNDKDELFKLLLASVEERAVDTYISKFGSTNNWIKKARVFDFVNTVSKSNTYKKDNLLGKLLTLTIYSKYIDDINDLIDINDLREFNLIKPKLDFIGKLIPNKKESSEEEVLEIALKRFKYVKNILYPIFSSFLKKAFDYLVDKKAVDSFLKEIEKTIESSEDKELKEDLSKKINELYPQRPPYFKEKFEKELEKLFKKKWKILTIKISKENRKIILKNEILPKLKNIIIELYKKNSKRDVAKIKDYLDEKFYNDFKSRREKLEVVFYGKKKNFFCRNNYSQINNLHRISDLIDGELGKDINSLSDIIHLNAQEIKEVNSKVKGSIDNYWKVVSSISELIRELKRYLKKDVENKNKKSDIYTSYGNKISLKRLYKRESSKHGKLGFNDKVFITKGFKIENPKKDFDWSVIISLDISGSMTYKIDAAIHGVILLAEVLSIKNIEFKIVAFHSIYFNIKEFEEQLDVNVRKKITGTKQLVGSYKNLDYQSLLKNFYEIKDRKASKKIVITISDGIIVEEVDTFFKEVEEYDNIKFIGIGIGEETEYIENHYPLGVHIKELRDLPIIIYKLLYDIIKHKK